ncbi:MAG: hypothetical protein ABR599_08205 [Gemmatimonadota bacterium]
MKTWIPLVVTLVLSLPASWGCRDGDVATAPLTDELGLEDVATADVVSLTHLEDLSEEDRAAVRAALEEARLEIRATRERFRSGEITRDEARDQVAAVHDALIGALSSLLSEEQIERLLRRGPDRPAPDLDLTEQQRLALQALRDEFRTFVRDVRAAVHDGEISARAGRHQVREKARETRTAFCALLTPEQRAHVPFCART